MGGKTKTSGQGRPKGVPNKATVAVKAAMQAVYADLQEAPPEGVEIGPHAHFRSWALGNPTEFYKLWSKLLPTEISGPDGGPIQTQGTVDVKAATEEQLRVLASLPVRRG